MASAIHYHYKSLPRISNYYFYTPSLIFYLPALIAWLAMRSTSPGAINFSHCSSLPRRVITSSRFRFDIDPMMSRAHGPQCFTKWFPQHTA